MRTHLEFVSTAFPPVPGEDEQVNAELYGKQLAQFLSKELASCGFAVSRVGPEDWGWRIDFDNPDFPLWLGCGNYQEYEADKKKRLGEEAAKPHRIKYKALK